VLAVSCSRRPHPVLVMAVGGTLDGETSDAFADYVDETLRTRPSTRALILDLTDLARLSADGSRAVHRARRRRGIRVLVVAGPSVASALYSRADVFATRRDAIAAAA
jgi:anti-anti-sigma regulatory factor